MSRNMKRRKFRDEVGMGEPSLAYSEVDENVSRRRESWLEVDHSTGQSSD